jgi:hypothetical protein
LVQHDSTAPEPEPEPEPLDSVRGVASQAELELEPEPKSVAEILMGFYKANYPEFATDNKVQRIIASFKAKADHVPGSSWQELLWAAYEKEGVDPRAETKALVQHDSTAPEPEPEPEPLDSVRGVASQAELELAAFEGVPPE